MALARALAPEPQLLLLDEPFSNLDVELRRRLSHEVRDILKSRGTSAILVTHDQEEAFAVSDQVGVFREGRLEQWDTPYNLYHEPQTPFVASFIGQGYFIRGQMSSHEAVKTEVGELRGNRAYTMAPGSSVDVLLRPDDIIHAPDSDLRANIVGKSFLGASTCTDCNCPPAASWKRSSRATSTIKSVRKSASTWPLTTWCCSRYQAVSRRNCRGRKTAYAATARRPDRRIGCCAVLWACPADRARSGRQSANSFYLMNRSCWVSRPLRARSRDKPAPPEVERCG